MKDGKTKIGVFSLSPKFLWGNLSSFQFIFVTLQKYNLDMNMDYNGGLHYLS